MRLSVLEEEVFSQLKIALSKAHLSGVVEASGLDDFFRASGVETLMLDYSRLFLGPFSILAKPYGSVYLDGEKIVMGVRRVPASRPAVSRSEPVSTPVGSRSPVRQLAVRRAQA